MYLKIDKINGTDTFLNTLDKIDKLKNELKDCVKEPIDADKLDNITIDLRRCIEDLNWEAISVETGEQIKCALYVCDPAKNTECKAAVDGVCTSEFCDYTSKQEFARLEKDGRPMKIVHI